MNASGTSGRLSFACSVALGSPGNAANTLCEARGVVPSIASDDYREMQLAFELWLPVEESPLLALSCLFEWPNKAKC